MGGLEHGAIAISFNGPGTYHPDHYLDTLRQRVTLGGEFVGAMALVNVIANREAGEISI
jgi:hypothetical protein